MSGPTQHFDRESISSLIDTVQAARSAIAAHYDSGATAIPRDLTEASDKAELAFIEAVRDRYGPSRSVILCGNHLAIIVGGSESNGDDLEPSPLNEPGEFSVAILPVSRFVEVGEDMRADYSEAGLTGEVHSKLFGK